MSMLDGFSGYNQDLVAEENKYKTTLTTPWGMHAYNRMPFRLKTVRDTF